MAVLLLTLISAVSAETLVLELERNNGVSLTDMMILEGEAPEVEENRGKYRIELLKNEEIIHERYISFEQKLRAPREEWFEGSEQVKIPESKKEKINSKVVKMPLKGADTVQLKEDGETHFRRDIDYKRERSNETPPTALIVAILLLLTVIAAVIHRRFK